MIYLCVRKNAESSRFFNGLSEQYTQRNLFSPNQWLHKSLRVHLGQSYGLLKLFIIFSQNGCKIGHFYFPIQFYNIISISSMVLCFQHLSFENPIYDQLRQAEDGGTRSIVTSKDDVSKSTSQHSLLPFSLRRKRVYRRIALIICLSVGVLALVLALGIHFGSKYIFSPYYMGGWNAIRYQILNPLINQISDIRPPHKNQM